MLEVVNIQLPNRFSFCLPSPSVATAATDWTATLFSGLLAAIAGGLIGAVALYWIFTKTDAAERGRERRSRELIEVDRLRRLRQAAAVEYLRELRTHKQAHRASVHQDVTYDDSLRDLMEVVSDSVTLFSAQIFADYSSEAEWLMSLRDGFRFVTPASPTVANQMLDMIDAVGSWAVNWAKDPEGTSMDLRRWTNG